MALRHTIYGVAIRAYTAGIRIASLTGNQKATDLLKARSESASPTKHPGQPLVWFHASSYGEYEQGRPLMEALKTQVPNVKILLSFYSPSGYFNIDRSSCIADEIVCMRPDFAPEARDFIAHYLPTAACFIQYDLWYEHLKALQMNDIPAFLLSANFRKDQPYFKCYGKVFREMLEMMRHIFVQNDRSSELLNTIGINNVSICGNMRYDRVLQNASKKKELPVLSEFTQAYPTLIAGSTWPADEKLLLDWFLHDEGRSGAISRLIIAPHEINEQEIAHLLDRAQGRAIRLSDAREHLGGGHDILVIDSIGLLSSAYSYADIAYIGGGFGQGIHSILEPAAFGLSSIFGPNYKRSSEAIELIEEGLVSSIHNREELQKALNFYMNNEDHREERKQNLLQFMHRHSGATESILQHILNAIPALEGQPN